MNKYLHGLKKIDNCTAVILCGGKSQRMGTDKALLKIGGKYLIVSIIEALESIFSEVILVTNHKEKFDGIEKLKGYKMAEDLYPLCGPMGAIYTSLINSSKEFCFVTACDLPIINTDLILKMYEEIQDAQGMVCERGGFIEPLYAFYHQSVTESFKRQMDSGRYRIIEVYKELSIKKHQINEEDFKIFLTNLNTPEDLEAFEKRQAGR